MSDTLATAQLGYSKGITHGPLTCITKVTEWAPKYLLVLLHQLVDVVVLALLDLQDLHLWG